MDGWVSLLIGVLRLRECDEWGWLHVETILSSIKRKFHLMHSFKCGEPVIATTSTLSATQSLIQSLTSTPPNRFPFSRQGPRQLVRQRRRRDNQCRTVSHLTHTVRFKYSSSFASTHRIFPNLCWLWCHVSFPVAHHVSDVQRGKQAPPKPIIWLLQNMGK